MDSRESNIVQPNADSTEDPEHPEVSEVSEVWRGIGMMVPIAANDAQRGESAFARTVLALENIRDAQVEMPDAPKKIAASLSKEK